MTSDDACPLCGGSSRPFFREGEREYLRCGACALTFVPARGHSDPARERERYAQHRNAPEDPGYRAFLDRLLGPLCAGLAAGSEGLDYGCGPGPTASRMLAERGFPVRDYDPFFAPDDGALRRTYGFIVCTEVLEHLRRPAEDFARLDGLLAPAAAGRDDRVLEDDAAFPAGGTATTSPTSRSIVRRHWSGWRGVSAGAWSGLRDAALFRKAA